MQTLFILITASLLASPQRSSPQAAADCVQTLSTDAKNIAADVSTIADQANAQGFSAAVEAFAADMETLLPTLTRPSQAAVQKFVTDLETAVSASSPGGTTITAGERLLLSYDWSALTASTGLTSAEVAAITGDLSAAMATLSGISTAQLDADLHAFATDALACAAQ